MLTIPADCTGCGACTAICPAGALTMQTAAGGFQAPVAAVDKCCNCGRCQAVCPAQEPPETELPERERFFAVRRRSAEKLFNSTSGGAFAGLAEQALREGKMVFGAAFDERLHLRHIGITSAAELPPLLTSKYVKSETAPALKLLRQELTAGRELFFCGLPCETAAALQLAGTGFRSRLLLADLICNGAPSPGVWRSYLRYLTGIFRKCPERFEFRNKSGHDDGHRVVCHVDGRRFTNAYGSDLFCRLFSKGLLCRDCCTGCRYAAVRRRTDLTLGDFWNYEKVHPEYDRMGISLVIVHTEAGLAALKQLEPEFDIEEFRREQVLQPRLETPPPSHPLRKFLLRQGPEFDFGELVRKFGKIGPERKP